MTTLFAPIQLGDLRLPNRIFMAPLTRSRGTEDHLPQADLMAKYYRQRATAGLILSEALPVAPMAVGYARVPGIWSPAQVEAWKPVTDAVHSENGTIFAQLWHVGRISHSRFLQGRLPVAPSAIQPAGHLSLVRPITPFEIPRALSLGEVKQIPELFQLAARHAGRRDLTAWSYTARTATCWINSYRVLQTRDLMNMAAALKTGLD